jgi:hypothetical protein
MLLFQIVALFREMNGWVVAAAAIGIALMLFELRRHAAFKDCQPSDAFLRDSLDW